MPKEPKSIELELATLEDMMDELGRRGQFVAAVRITAKGRGNDFFQLFSSRTIAKRRTRIATALASAAADIAPHICKIEQADTGQSEDDPPDAP